MENPSSPRASNGAVGRWLPPLLLAAVTMWAFRDMLGHGLWSDDFRLILTNRDLGIGGSARFLFCADYGGRDWVYWRPGWVFLFWLLHATFGPEALAYKCAALALHTGCVLTLYAVACASTRSRALAFAAALLFALLGAHAEAVVWVAAALNVLPAATLLIAASWLAFRHATGASGRTLLASWLLAAASLLWKEAAYGFPLVLLGAWWSGRARGAWTKRDTASVAAAAAFGALVVGHYLLLSKKTGLAGSVADILLVLAVSIAGLVKPLVAVPGNDIMIARGAVLLAVAAIAVARGPTRFWLVAAVAGTLPYAFLTGGGRFSYFFHAPLCVALATGLAVALRVHAAPWRVAVGTGLLLLPLWLSPVSLRAQIEHFGAEAANADHILSSLVKDGHADSGRLLVDRVPLCLVNGFEPALALRFGRSVELHSFETMPRPPFLIHVDVSGRPFPTDSSLLHFDFAAQRYVAMPKELLAGLTPVPLFAICHRFRVVAGEAEARALLAAGGATPAVEPLLYEAPQDALDPAAGGSVVGPVRTDVRNLGVRVSCTGPSLLVVAFPLPVDFRKPPGAIWVDGVPVPVLTANILFHAVVIPAGTHDVRLLPAPGG